MQNEIRKALSILTSHTVRHLLMGGQACVLYGAAQFSRDADINILATTGNLDRFRAALQELQAEVIAVPPFDARYLERGLAVHFRCRRSDFANLRIDVMSVMRGVDPFPQLWDRRTTLEFAGGQRIDVLSVADLVKAKKTQRDKDWPMIRALIEAHYAQNRDQATPESISFWLRDARTPEILIDVARQHIAAAQAAKTDRPLLELAISDSVDGVRAALIAEQQREQELDRQYWKPLIAELERG